MFAIVDPDNSQHITLNDNAGEAPTEAWIIGNDCVRATYIAVMSYARKHHIRPSRVGYAVRPLREGEY